jgi:hypothetical protein
MKKQLSMPLYCFEQAFSQGFKKKINAAFAVAVLR